MQDPRPKRPWFQLHLSTCMVMMLVAGVLVGVNVHCITHSPFRDGRYDYFYEYGWPVPNKRFSETEFWWITDGPMLNIATNLGILLSATSAFEWWTRRRRALRP